MTNIIKETDDSIEIKTEAKFITINTEYGGITIFMGNNHKDITTYIDDVNFTGFYNTIPKKNTSQRKVLGGSRMVTLREQ